MLSREKLHLEYRTAVYRPALCVFKKDTGAVEVVQWLGKALSVLVEALDLISGPIPHMVAQNHLTPVPKDPEPSSEPLHAPDITCEICTWRQNTDIKQI